MISPRSRDRAGVPTRRARAIRTRPIVAGEVVKLVPDDGLAYDYLTFRSPSGFIGLAPIDGNSYRLWVPEVGAWTYRWGDGSEHLLEVIESTAAPAAIVRDQAAVDTSLLPSASLFRRPMY